MSHISHITLLFLNVAEYNLGEVKLETMLARCLSLEFTGVVLGLSHGYLGFYGYHVEVISFHSCYITCTFTCVYFCSLPSPPFGKY